MPHKIWLRVNLPVKDLAALQQDFPNCEFYLTGGRAIEEKLLVRTLKENWLAGAVLDAFAKQPLSEDSELWSLPNVIITPRIAGITSQKWPAVLPAFKENLRRFVAGEPLREVCARHSY